jgi:hypothetical protein
MDDQVKKELVQLRAEVAELKKQSVLRVSWEDKQTDSGIKIEGGPTTIRRTGVVVGSTAVPVGPQSLAILFVVKRDGDNEMLTLGPKDCKVIE